MNNIDNILNNYFEGTASSDEVKTLKNYFRSDNVSHQHEIYKPLFAAFDEEKQVASPVFEIPKENKKRIISRKLWITAASAAAAILLIFMLFPIKNRTETQSDYLVFINGKEITNPRKARQYADEMFMQADEIIRSSYEPFVEANVMQTEMNADKIFDNLYQQINYIENQ